MRRLALTTIHLLGGIAVTLGAIPDVSFAQGGALEEIVVTARQREEKLEDVPATITAFTEAAINQAGIERAEDFIALTPGVSIVDAAEVGDTQVSIRGINGSRDGEANFAFIVDGILYTNPSSFNREFADLKQIEVLKGPQGAIYGRSAAAGAVIITTQDPTDEFSAKIKASGGDHGTYYTSAVASGSLIKDQLKGRLHFDYRNTDGFYRNQFNQRRGVDDENVDDLRNFNVNGDLLWEPSDALSVRVRGHYGEVHAAAITFNSTFNLPSAAAFTGNPLFFEDPNDHQFVFQGNVDPDNDQKSRDFSIKADYDMGWATLTGWYLYSQLDQDFIADGTSGAFSFFIFDPQAIDAAHPNGGCGASTVSLSGQGVALPSPQILGTNQFPFAVPGNVNGLPPNLTGSLLGAYTPTTCDGYQYQIRDQDDSSFEVRLTSPSDQRLRWQTGFYFLNLNRKVGVAQLRDDGRPVLPQQLVNPLTEALVFDKFDTGVISVFGSLDYDVTDDLQVSVALRYDREDRDAHSLVPPPSVQRSNFVEYTAPFLFFPFGASVCPDGIPGSPLNPAFVDFSTCTVSNSIPARSQVFDQLEPKISLDWHATDDTSYYFSWGVGFKSGGFNNAGSAATVKLFYNTPLLDPAFSVIAPAFLGGSGSPVPLGGAGVGAGLTISDTFRKETSNAFEVGFRTQFADGRVKMEGAVYHTLIDNMQFFNFFVGPFGLLRVVSNIDDVTITGAEFSLSAQMTDAWRVYGSTNVLKGQIENNKNRPQTVGNDVPYAPDFTINLGSEFIKPAFDNPSLAGIDFVGRIDYSVVGPTWFHTVQEDNPTPNLFTPFGFGLASQDKSQRDTYGIWNVRTGFQSEKWSALLTVRNLLNQDYLEEIIPAPEFGGAFDHPGARRSWNIELSYQF
ncbi:MAG: TonB-dependent receptor [Gammaproteobacteria bacterium]